MSDKIFLKDITLPIVETGEDETYSFVQTDSDLEREGDAADAKKTGDEITQLKADLTSIETDIESGNLTAGTSKQLLADTGMTDKSPYLFREMPTGAGDREEPVIVGGSVVWNQLVQNGDFSDGTSGWAPYLSGNGSIAVSDGTLTYTSATAGSSGYGYGFQRSLLNRPVIGHKYLYCANVRFSMSGVKAAFEFGGSEPSNVAWKELTANTWTSIAHIVSASMSSNRGLMIKPKGGSLEIGSTMDYRNIMLTDLTAMFGTAVADYVYALESATAGAGIAWLKKYGFFTQTYYPYSEPTFKHVEGLTAHKMVGFNQWNEEWESGSFDQNTGRPIINADWSLSKDYIKVLPGATYYFQIDGLSSSNGAFVFYYDVDKNFLGYDSLVVSNHRTLNGNVEYIRIQYKRAIAVVTDYKVCINLSNPAKNGTYDPYKSYTYPLDPDVVLRGFPKLDSNNNLYFDGDVYKPDGTVERRYIEVLVDGGINGLAFSGAWGAEANGYMVYISTGLGARSYNAISDRFIVSNAGIAVMPLMSFIGASGSSATWSFALPSTVTSLAEANTWASNNPFHIIIPRSTPTTETADPYAPLQLADPYGTEEWVLDENAFPMPVGQETFYPENLRAKIEGLPWNFASLIAPTETTLTATRAYTTGQLFIVDNVLYQATTSIASGGTITPGTNCTATTLAEVISAL